MTIISPSFSEKSYDRGIELTVMTNVWDFILDQSVHEAAESAECLDRLRQVAKEGGNIFECIMDIVEHCTLGQITEVLFETQGRFRRDL